MTFTNGKMRKGLYCSVSEPPPGKKGNDELICFGLAFAPLPRSGSLVCSLRMYLGTCIHTPYVVVGTSRLTIIAWDIHVLDTLERACEVVR